MLKLGLGVGQHWESGAREPYRAMIELAVAAEKAGFDYITQGHHSVTPDNHDPAAPFVTLAAMAAHTSRIRLGTGIYLLPLHHPVAVAEQALQLDQLSGGRVIFGVGVGYRPYEYAAFGVDFKSRGARLDEAMAAIRGGWETGHYEFSGRHFSIPRTIVDPPPAQSPHPPIWVGGISDAALRRAAKWGDGWISDNAMTIAGEKERIDTYHRLCADEGRPEGTVAIMRNAWVAATRAEVERDWLPAAIKFHLDYLKAGSNLPDEDGIFARLQAGEPVSLEEFADQRGIAGTPDDCIAQLRRWHDATGCDHVQLILSGMGGFDAKLRVIEMFGRDVIPALA
ncbi:MAG: LLM class flavin-dependent oxidoreductase [Novosphingobium sp.]|nr:LLM class flavin-dependent oxidoreductase [Novosphingobium sp.]